ncbi:MAG: DUF2505 domain-containing protein [Pseudonocardia sp.]|nr:DUF2505 domain-containing protein [Pseudonocardia sp.]
MARSIDYRSTLAYPAEKVFVTMTDEEYLRARLRDLGGPGSELLEHEAGPQGARYRLKQGLSEKDLPPIVGKVMQGDLTIQRTESLRATGPGAYAGDVDVAISGVPASASGTMRLTDNGTGGEFEVHATVEVKVPLFGGKIEEIIAGQVRRLLAAETAFTVRWLGSH